MKFVKLSFCLLLFLLLFGCTKAPTGEASRQVNLKFLTESNLPMSFLRDSKPAGMAVDIVNAIANKLNFTPDIKFNLWHRAYNIALHAPNVILFPTFRNEKREELFSWIGPIVNFNCFLYTKKHSGIKINNLEEAKEYKIATVRGFFSEDFLIENGFKKLYRYSTPIEALEALLRDQVQLVVLSNMSAEALLRVSGHSVHSIIPVYKTQTGNYYIAISKGTPEAVIQEWEDAFKIIKRNKTYYKIYKKWFISSAFSLYK